MLFQRLKWLGATALMGATLTQVVPAHADTPSPSIADCAAIQRSVRNARDSSGRSTR